MGGLVGQCWVSARLTRYQLPGSGVPVTVGDSPRVKKTISILRGTVLRTKYYFCSVLLWWVDVAESAVPVLIKPLKIFPPPVTTPLLSGHSTHTVTKVRSRNISQKLQCSLLLISRTCHIFGSKSIQCSLLVMGSTGNSGLRARGESTAPDIPARIICPSLPPRTNSFE